MHISIVIPVHNRIAFTRSCLESLQKQTNKNFNTVVVDDGSTDGTNKMVENEFPEVHLIKGTGNLWWTAATNLGVKYALENNADYVLTLNNDLYVRQDYLHNLLNVIEKEERSLIGSVSVEADNHSRILDAGVKINWKTAKYDYMANNINKNGNFGAFNELQSVDALSGRGTLIPVKAFRELGFFNDKYLPHYGADYEFAVRAKKNGYKLYVCKKAIVYSYVKETGLNNFNRRISWAELIKSFFSIKSPNNLKYRMRFAKLTAPKYCFITFLVFDYLRVIVKSFIRQFQKKN